MTRLSKNDSELSAATVDNHLSDDAVVTGESTAELVNDFLMMVKKSYGVYKLAARNNGDPFNFDDVLVQSVTVDKHLITSDDTAVTGESTAELVNNFLMMVKKFYKICKLAARNNGDPFNFDDVWDEKVKDLDGDFWEMPRALSLRSDPSPSLVLLNAGVNDSGILNDPSSNEEDEMVAPEGPEDTQGVPLKGDVTDSVILNDSSSNEEDETPSMVQRE